MPTSSAIVICTESTWWAFQIGSNSVVGEAQRQQVLDRLLAEVVVDPEDVLRGEDVVDEVVERLGRRQVVAERLLDDDPPPAARLAVVGHAGALHLLEHRREGRRRDRQVEGRVALRAVRAVEVAQRLARLSKAWSSSKLPGRNLIDSHSRDQVDSRNSVRAPFCRGAPSPALEVAVAPVAPGEAEQHEAGRQQPAVGEVVDRRDELLLARSPVTPKTTSTHGSGTRGSRRSPGERSGLPGWRRHGRPPAACGAVDRPAVIGRSGVTVAVASGDADAGAVTRRARRRRPA